MEKIIEYNGYPITFSQGENMMINATQMAKPFCKSAKDWLRTQSAKDYIAALSEVKKILSPDLVKVTHGDNGGTWMDEDVALEFARWLSPEFAIWCNAKIKELLKTGYAELQPRTFAEALRLAADQAEELERQQAKIAEDAPKVQLAEAIVASKSSCLIGELAKVLTQNGYEIGQNRLFKILREEGYLGKYGEYHNIPQQKYVEMGLFQIKKSVREGKYGETHTVTTTKVTGKGLQYFINKFLPSNNSKQITNYIR